MTYSGLNYSVNYPTWNFSHCWWLRKVTIEHHSS